jgi:SAM-dependent methyltransferase
MSANAPVEIGLKIPRSNRDERVVADRLSAMFELARGKRVLNVGCAGSDAVTTESPMHKRIAELSAYCVGIDIFESGIERLKSDGHRVILGDAETFELEERDFQVALLGDIIEHVSNPGKVFDQVNKHLVMGGLIVVSTPNPFSLPLMIKMILGYQKVVNSEHVTWFDPTLLGWLMERSGFLTQEVVWTDQSRVPPIRWLQNRRKDLNSTFIIVGKKNRPMA